MSLGITTVQKDRAPWVKEWIAFHYLVGFRKFYFYANCCEDNTAQIVKRLKHYFDINLIELSKPSNTIQLEVYRDTYQKHGNEFDWMAFIDADEFLFPAKADNIEEPLSGYSGKQLSALGVYWACFGSSGYIKEPSGLIIENYKQRAKPSYPNNRHIKSIVRGGLGKSVTTGTSHLFNTPLGTVDELFRPITSGWTDYKPSYEKFRINHYVTQSRSFYLNWKKTSGSIEDGRPEKYIRGEDWWLEHDKNDVTDHSVDRFNEPLKKLLADL